MGVLFRYKVCHSVAIEIELVCHHCIDPYSASHKKSIYFDAPGSLYGRNINS